jgi:hypothetical protein
MKTDPTKVFGLIATVIGLYIAIGGLSNARLLPGLYWIGAAGWSAYMMDILVDGASRSVGPSRFGENASRSVSLSRPSRISSSVSRGAYMSNAPGRSDVARALAGEIVVDLVQPVDGQALAGPGVLDVPESQVGLVELFAS